MAGMFYSLQEAAEKLNKTQKQIKQLVKEGKLREFRDGPNRLFKVDEIEGLMEQDSSATADIMGPAEAPEPPRFHGGKLAPAEAGVSEPESPEMEIPELAIGGEGILPSEKHGQDGRATGEPVAGIPESEIPEEEPAEEPLDLARGGEPVEPEIPMPEMAESLDFAQDGEPAEPPQEAAAGTDEILLAPETGAPAVPSDLTDADTALTGLGTSVLGETDQDYEVTGDTMAETAVPTGTGGTTPEMPLEEVEEDVNLDTFGSGSGLLDLSLQADDTSLGGILDEIYTAEGEGKEPAEAEAAPAEAAAVEPEQVIPEEELVAAQPTPEALALAAPYIEAAPDAQSNMLGMLLFLPLVVVIYTTVVAVAGLKGVMPSILESIQGFIWYIMGGAAVLSLAVVGAAFLLTGERSATTKKEKKPKEPKRPKEPKAGKKGTEV